MTPIGIAAAIVVAGAVLGAEVKPSSVWIWGAVLISETLRVYFWND